MTTIRFIVAIGGTWFDQLFCVVVGPIDLLVQMGAATGVNGTTAAWVIPTVFCHIRVGAHHSTIEYRLTSITL